MIFNDIVLTLKNAGIENALHEARLITSHITGISEAKILSARFDEIEVSAESLAALTEAIERRCERYPLQYIIGQWEFMGIPFEVNENCLIPRSDTELLCETAMSKLPENGKFLDLCTGSGCIALAVAHHRPDVEVTALEKYPAPLNVAKKNCENLFGSIDRVRFIEADVCSHISALGYFGSERFDFIAANPPYVTADEMDTLEPELSYEPRHALTDECDGLTIIRSIIHIYRLFLKPRGYLAIEHGRTQGPAIRAIMRNLGYRCETLKDLSGNERVTILRTPPYNI